MTNIKNIFKVAALGLMTHGMVACGNVKDNNTSPAPTVTDQEQTIETLHRLSVEQEHIQKNDTIHTWNVYPEIMEQLDPNSSVSLRDQFIQLHRQMYK